MSSPCAGWMAKEAVLRVVMLKDHALHGSLDGGWMKAQAAAPDAFKVVLLTVVVSS